MKRFLLAFGLVAVAAISAACSSAAAQPQPSGPVVDGPTVVAKDLKFVTASIELPADKNVTVHLDNQDSAPHNLAIYGDSGYSQKISIGEIVTSKNADQVVPALKAGSYFFRCDVHPDMKGTITVK
ncbi:MAG TPA: cupredoxin domain-containing protein [Candidatus Limnocylindrales bacterium]|nr:cupredoxin domain-containing protein [Candidatus Limnocylindrales bacterium]